MKNFVRVPSGHGGRIRGRQASPVPRRPLRGSDVIIALTLLTVVFAFGGQLLADFLADEKQTAFNIRNTIAGVPNEPV